jgi:hypothetical protein
MFFHILFRRYWVPYSTVPVSTETSFAMTCRQLWLKNISRIFPPYTALLKMVNFFWGYFTS